MALPHCEAAWNPPRGDAVGIHSAPGEAPACARARRYRGVSDDELEQGDSGATEGSRRSRLR